MKTISLLLLIPALSMAAPAPQKNQPRAVELLRKVDDLWRGEASHAVMSMHVKAKHYERRMKMEGWTMGTQYSLVRILEPAKEKGTATLKAVDTMYSYLPRTDRSIKLSSGMMGSSWMGSHFTNDDLIQQSRLSRDYDVVIAFEGERKGQNVVELELMPKPDAAVVWGKIVSVIDSKSYLPVQTRYFDEDLKQVRMMSFADVKMMGGRMVPAVLRLSPDDAPEEFTQMTYESLDPNPEISKDWFSLSRLKRR